jgi:uncharacterized CHY-type Zn-finger protein
MTEDAIFCSQCNKDLAMKFIEIKDLVFCSNHCLDSYIKTIGQKKFFRQYGDVFVPGEGKGWVPRYANDYIMMCGRCPKKLSDVCHENSQISAAYHDTLGDAEEYRWCCHARFCLSAALSDGTVPFESGLAVQRYAEQKARENKVRGVTTVIFSQSIADLAKNFRYQKLAENPPEMQEPDMSHFGACMLCDEPFGRQCEEQVEREFQFLAQARSLAGDRMWCGHTVNALADILIDRPGGEELAKKIIDLADRVAEEKGHPGVITRSFFIALGRML